jgi:hypothetical protein
VFPCINKTDHFGLETKLTNKIIDEILNDGRLTLVNNTNEAEYILFFKINKYVIKELSSVNFKIYYNSMINYKLYVSLSVTLADKNNNIIFYKPNVRSIHIYTTCVPITNNYFYNRNNNNETYAINYLFDRLAKNIVKQVIHFIDCS